MNGLVVDKIFLFALHGERRIGQISLGAHMRQTAAQAERAAAPPALIAAALLHDIGHFLDPIESTASVSAIAKESAIDCGHEVLAARWLGQWFDSDVVLPIALHVEAKRYLCATEPRYWRALGDQGRALLAAQGGMMDVPETEIFERHPAFAAALRLRAWDDAANVIGGTAPPLDYFRPLLTQLLAGERALSLP